MPRSSAVKNYRLLAKQMREKAADASPELRKSIEATAVRYELIAESLEEHEKAQKKKS